MNRIIFVTISAYILLFETISPNRLGLIAFSILLVLSYFFNMKNAKFITYFSVLLTLSFFFFDIWLGIGFLAGYLLNLLFLLLSRRISKEKNKLIYKFY